MFDVESGREGKECDSEASKAKRRSPERCHRRKTDRVMALGIFRKGRSPSNPKTAIALFIPKKPSPSGADNKNAIALPIPKSTIALFIPKKSDRLLTTGNKKAIALSQYKRAIALPIPYKQSPSSSSQKAIDLSIPKRAIELHNL